MNLSNNRMFRGTPIFGKIKARAERHPLMFIGVMVFMLVLPFMGKPLHIDDPLFVWSAQQISRHPGNFYGFDVNWTGYTVPMSVENRNPPANSYFLAGVAALFGWREIFLHAAMMLAAFAAAAGTYQLARIWCERPLLAAGIALATPVFFVSATTLMCDVPMLAIWIWAVVFWERAMTSGNALEFFMAAFLAGLSVLTKYSALTLLPLLPILGFLRKKPGLWLLWLAVPTVMIVLYQLWTASLYGNGLISSAAGFASKTHFELAGGWTNKTVIGFAYAGGCLLPVLFFIPWLPVKRELVVISGLVVVGSASVLWLTGIGHEFGWSFRLQMCLWVAAGMHLLLLTAYGLWRQRDTVSLMLALWLASGFIFAAVLNWTVSARSFLPMVPAIAILVVRNLTRPEAQRKKQPAYYLPVAASMVFSVLIATADYATAGSEHAAAQYLSAHYPPSSMRVWFQGHWGLQYYLQKAGAQPVDFSRSVLSPGDILILPSNNSNIIIPEPQDANLVMTPEFTADSWLSTVNDTTGVGFYGEGLLPFLFGPVAAEKYAVYQVTRTMKPPYFIWLAWQTPKVPPEVLNNLAWTMATSGKADDRDGTRAVLFAERACQLTGYHETVMVGTLGAAYAEAGRFDDAIVTAQKACDLATASGKTDLLKINQQLLDLYRQHQPYHEETKP